MDLSNSSCLFNSFGMFDIQILVKYDGKNSIIGLKYADIFKSSVTTYAGSFKPNITYQFLR